jgi:flagellar biogenesis protein FliO
MIPAFLLSAQDPDGVPRAGVAELAGSQGPDLLRYVLVCGFLILLIVALGWGFKRLSAGSLRGRAGRRALQTLDVLPLGGRAKVAVVRCYDKSYLIGIGDKEIRLLDALDAAETETDEAPELSALNAVGRTAGGFLAALKARVGEVPERKPARPAAAASAVHAAASVLRPPRPAQAAAAAAPRAPRLPGGGLLG